MGFLLLCWVVYTTMWVVASFRVSEGISNGGIGYRNLSYGQLGFTILLVFAFTMEIMRK